MRECGDCSACCEGWIANRIEVAGGVTEIFPGQGCRYCVGHGCSVYETRPQSPCRSFSCMWLTRESEFPEEMRPDISRAIVVDGMSLANWDVLTAIPVGSTVPEATIDWLRLYSRQVGMPLVYDEREEVSGKFTGLGTKSYFGPSEFVDAVANQVQPEDVIKFS